MIYKWSSDQHRALITNSNQHLLDFTSDFFIISYLILVLITRFNAESEIHNLRNFVDQILVARLF